MPCRDDNGDGYVGDHNSHPHPRNPVYIPIPAPYPADNENPAPSPSPSPLGNGDPRRVNTQDPSNVFKILCCCSGVIKMLLTAVLLLLTLLEIRDIHQVAVQYRGQQVKLFLMCFSLLEIKF
ncbi:hypothetical protein LXL04_031124 [Taraxacum kok-saghyz]